MKCMDRTAKKIMDTLAEACHVPIREVCVLNHNDEHFKAYVHGTNWYGQHVYDKIMKTWDVVEENITMNVSPGGWWSLGSRGYIIEVSFK